jgi:phage shock protein A
MGIFKRVKDGIGAKANAALDKAIDPAKELDMAILELEEGRKKALAELVSYKTTAKQMEQEIEKLNARAADFEKKAMIAVKAGDDELARTALKEKKNALVEAAKVAKDRDEAAGYAIQLNKSRKTFETKLQVLKMRKGTLATQIAAARSAGGDAFGNSGDVWDKFKRAEERIDAEAIETEVVAALRGDDAMATADFDAKLLAAAGADKAVGAGGLDPDAADRALDALKAKVAAQREARQKLIAEAQAKALPEGSEPGPGARKPDKDDR